MIDKHAITEEKRADLAEKYRTAGADGDATIRSTFAKAHNGDMLLELEWRNGPRDGESFAAVFSPEAWLQFVEGVNEMHVDL